MSLVEHIFTCRRFCDNLGHFCDKLRHLYGKIYKNNDTALKYALRKKPYALISMYIYVKLKIACTSYFNEMLHITKKVS